MSSPAPEKPRFVVVPHRRHARLLLAGAGVLWLASLVGVGWWATSRAVPELAQVRQELNVTARRAAEADTLVRQLRQNVATLRRSDQISRSANTELQATLAEREEEVSALRADVAFYERLVGATGQRKGLGVHVAEFEPASGGTWRYQIMLTQTLNRGAISQGQMRFIVEGVRAGKLATVQWDELHQQRSAPAQAYSFRYFQQLEGSIMLPDGFTPQRVRVQLRADGHTVDQAFPWTAPDPRGD